jgi:hypothetical protein
MVIIREFRGVFLFSFTDSITGKYSDGLMPVSEWCVGGIPMNVLLDYTTDGRDG